MCGYSGFQLRVSFVISAVVASSMMSPAARAAEYRGLCEGFDSIFCESTDWVSPGDSCHCCDRLFAPPMIGDSLGVPIAVGNVNTQVLHTQHYSKIADHNSPIPRTRVFGSYQRFDSYSAVETAANNDIRQDLNVYKLGFEKTVFDGNGSIDFLLPMYQTLSPNSAGTATSMTDDVGNIAFGYKHVLYEGDNCLISAGLRVEAPTEQDIFTGGAQLVLDQWQYQPWVGFIAQGEDDTFLHCFISGRYAGDDIEAFFEEFHEGEGFEFDFGNFNTEYQTLFNVDVGVGKWIHLSNNIVRAIVPTLELHYTHASGADAPFGLTGDIFGKNVDMLNLTLGTTAYVGENSILQVGFGIPLHSNDSVNPGGVNGNIDTAQFYDWELLVHWTVFRR